MGEKALDNEIKYYLEHLNAHQKEVVLSVVKTFAQEEDDWWASVESAAADSIERGMKQARVGETISHDEVMKGIRK